MIQGLLNVSGLLILKIVYGKQYKEKVDNPEKRPVMLMLFLSLLNLGWITTLLALFLDATDDGVTFLWFLVIGYPAVIAIWTALERKRQNEE